MFALKETVASKRRGEDVWFKMMTEIGPSCTSDPNERAIFATEEEALRSPAMLFSLTFFDPVEVEAARA